MTWLGQMYEKEKIEYANQKVAKRNLDMAKSMLDEDIDIIKIMRITGLSEEELQHLKEECVTA